MKNKITFIIVGILALLATSCSCSRGSLRGANKQPDSTVELLKPDVVKIHVSDSDKIDSLFNELRNVQDSLKITKDSMVYYRDTIEYQNYINARRIEKIKYYINICDKRSTNKKYFFGWIKRTMSE